MLLKITYKGNNSRDLGYLLHKNPDRAQVFELAFGRAYVFYSDALEDKTTACLLLDINPIDLARGKLGSKSGGLFDYVNDRPYASSSFMAIAINRIFSSALAGRCNHRQDLVKEKLDLEAEIIMLPCGISPRMIDKLFNPLGYEIQYNIFPLDEKFPNWKSDGYVNLTIKGKVKLCDLLRHLYILIPIFDNRKHYWINEQEIEKLMNYGAGWLENHPEKSLIATRYLNKKKSLINSALAKLNEGIEDNNELDTLSNDGDISPSKMLLNDYRINEVVNFIRNNNNIKTVIDIGCGEGKLISKLIHNINIEKIIGVDIALDRLEMAKDRLDLRRVSGSINKKVELIQGSLTYKDKRFSGYDCACLIEVIEHIDLPRLATIEKVLFKYACPKIVIITTPNREYNSKYDGLNENEFRHSDHRFEWTRREFQEWGQRVASQYGYEVDFSDIGEMDEVYGSPTQMGVFKNENPNT